MAFLAPVIAPLIGLGGLGLVGEAIVGIGLSFGVSYLARKLQPQPSNQAAQGMQLSLSYNANGPRQIAFGLAASAGSLVYHNTYGPNGNDYVQLVFKLADSPCTSLESVFIDGKKCTLGAEVTTGNQTGYTVDEYPGVMWIKFHEGAWDQAADADLVAKATGTSGWSTNNRGRGVCYVRVTLKYDAEKYKNGIPPFLFVFKGAKVYDIRKDSTAGGSGAHRWGDESTYEWTDNPAVCLYNYKRGIYVNGKKVGGMNVPGVSMPVDVWTAAANACNESVNLKAGGSEKRYRLNGIVDVDSEHATVVRDMVSTMAGTLADASGVFKLYAGVSRAPVLTITDDDLISNAPVKFVPKLSRSGLVNAVFGSFNDPEKLYQSSSLPPRISPDDEEADGGVELTENYSLAYVSSQTQGQRILEILRRKGRYQRSLSQTLCAKAAMLESGDWITFNSKRYGFEGVTFEVTLGTLNRDATVPVELREVSAGIYPWSAASDELDPLNPHDVGPGGERFSTVQVSGLFPVVITTGTSIQRPGLRIEWTPVDDATVTTLELEYRQVGTEAVLKDTIFDPTVGQYTFTTGIQSGVEYEARMNLITAPPRATVWSAWKPTDTSTAPQVVAVAALATSVPPNTITPEMLDAQSRFLLSLIAATDEILGGVNERVKAIADRLNDSSEATIRALMAGDNNSTDIRQERTQRITATDALAEQITTVEAKVNNEVAAQITQIIQAYTAADVALASEIDIVASALGDNVSTVSVLVESVNGIKQQFTVALNQNGRVIGLIDLSGENGTSAFTVEAGQFLVALTGASGGDPVPVFSIQNVNGSPKLALRGDMVADGSISARHINAASISTLYISDPDDTYFWNFATGQDGRTDGTWLMDRKNKTWDIIF